MSRNKLYQYRLEICLNKEQYKIIKDLARKSNKRYSEIIRELLTKEGG